MSSDEHSDWEPRDDEEIVEVARELIKFLEEHPEHAPGAPVPVPKLKKSLATFENACDKEAISKLVLELALADAEESFRVLVRDITTNYLAGHCSEGNRTKTLVEVPGQPFGLRVVPMGEGLILLDWKEPADGGMIALYRIEVRLPGDNKWIMATSAMETTSTVKVNVPAKTLEYRVVAVNIVGESAPSDVVAVLL